MKVADITTLSELRKAIKYNKRVATKLRGKSFYFRMNKNYRYLNWDKPVFQTSQIKQSFDDDFFKCWRRLYADKDLLPHLKSGEAFYNKTNVQGLCLLKQVAAQLQQRYYMKPPKKNKKKKVKKQYVPFHFDSIYLGKCYICSYPKTMQWKAPLLTQFLSDKQYIFDQTNQFGRPLKDLRRFIGKNLMNGRVQKWDFYFKRFLTKTN